MNKKGFTLAELLGVIVILGILAVVAFPPLLNQLNKSKDKLSDATLKVLGTAAELYVDEHSSSYPIRNGNVYCIKLETLVNYNYLKSPIMDASSGEEIDITNNYIKFKVNKFNDYDYELVTECSEKRDVSITYTITFDATGGEVSTNTKEVTENSTYGELPIPTKDGYNFTGWYTSETEGDKIESTTSVTITGNQTLYARWEIPTGVLAIIYLDPTDLSKECHSSNSVSTTGTKSGCMKWYAYSETDDTYTMILDHNTTAKVNSWSEASTQLEADTAGWVGEPRLITGQEVADITGNTSWTSTGYWFYLDSNSQTQTATSEGASKYYWLYDYTYKCTNYGCKVVDNSTDGYWTSTSYNSSNAWYVACRGYLNYPSVSTTTRGVRPVITISKSSLE